MDFIGSFSMDKRQFSIPTGLEKYSFYEKYGAKKLDLHFEEFTDTIKDMH